MTRLTLAAVFAVAVVIIWAVAREPRSPAPLAAPLAAYPQRYEGDYGVNRANPSCFTNQDWCYSHFGEWVEI